VGSVMYAALCTRADMGFTMSQISRFSSAPGRVHWEAVKRAIRYLKGTAGWCLTYNGAKGTKLEAYSDSDFSACPDTSKSTSGQVIMLAGGAVDWKSTK